MREKVIWGSVLCIFLAGVLGWSVIAPDLAPGPPRPGRPVLAFLALWLSTWVAFTAMLVLLQRRRNRWRMAVLVGLLARLVLLPSGLILESDPYRYQLDGNLVLAGENPYLHSPLAWPIRGGDAFRTRLEQPGADFILQNISYPEIPTVYPPAAQVAFAMGAVLTGWDWHGQRIVFLLVDLLVLLGLYSWFREHRVSPAPMVFYACNPLILKEVANSAHLDVLVALFLVLTLIALSRLGGKSVLLPAAVGGWGLGMAVLSKIYPAMLFPLLVLFCWRRSGGWKAPILFAVSCGLTVLIGLLPLLGVDVGAQTVGLSRYARTWTMNQGAFELFTLLGERARVVAFGTIALAALAIAWRFRDNDRPRRLAMAMSVTLLIWWLLMPSPFPWYGVPLLALIPCTESRGWYWVGSVFTLVGAAYYGGFLVMDAGLDAWRPVSGWLAHAAVWVTIGLAFWRKPGSIHRSEE